MRNSIRLGLTAFLISFCFETVFYIFDLASNSTIGFISFAFHSLNLITVVLYSIVNWKKNGSNNKGTIDKIKSGFTISFIFSLLISIYFFSYHKWINPEYLNTKKTQLIELTLKKSVLEDAQERIKQDPNYYDGKSAEDLVEMQQDNIKEVLMPSKILPISIFTFLFIGMFFTILIALMSKFLDSKFNK